MSAKDPSIPPTANSIESQSDAPRPIDCWLGASLFWRIFLLQVIVAIPVALLMPVSDEYIRLKPSVIYFAMVFVLVIASLVSKQGILYQLCGVRLGLAAASWRRFNWLLVAYYVAMAIGNMILIFTTSVETWVQIKFYVPIISLVALCFLAPMFGLLRPPVIAQKAM